MSKSQVPRNRSSQRFALTGRDIEILASVSAARYLSVESIEWLHFPVWRERYAQWQVAQQRGDERRYVASSHAYRRMRWLVEQRWVRRIVRPAMLAVDTYRREPDLFFLTEHGARLLAEHRGLDIETLHVGEARQRSYLMLRHHVEVGRVYAALRCNIEEKPGLRFAGWRSEHDFQRDFDTLHVFVPGTDGSGKREDEGPQPDGAFCIEHPRGQSLFFVEVERDQPLNKWKRKVWAYEAYLDSPQLRARFGSRTFGLLGIARDAHQQKRLLQATAEALAMLSGDPPRRASAFERYLVSHMGQAHRSKKTILWLRA